MRETQNISLSLPVAKGNWLTVLVSWVRKLYIWLLTKITGKMPKKEKYVAIQGLINKYLEALKNKVSHLDTNYLLELTSISERSAELSIGIRKVLIEVRVLNTMKGVKVEVFELADNENDYGKIKKSALSSLGFVSPFIERDVIIDWSIGADTLIDKIESETFETI